MGNWWNLNSSYLHITISNKKVSQKKGKQKEKLNFILSSTIYIYIYVDDILNYTFEKKKKNLFKYEINYLY